MEIFLDRRSIRQIRQSAADAVEDGDTETLREDVFQAFSDEQVEQVERLLDGGDLIDFLADAIEEWDGEDVDELFEVLETHLADVGVELKYGNPELDDEDEEEETEEDDFDEDDEEDSLDDDMELPEEEL
ncbi:MAG: hypothetical protein OXU20_24390 [Myxococcales bacterium]|nr:hypothetical protein [Myxococcales bacterium]